MRASVRRTLLVAACLILALVVALAALALAFRFNFHRPAPAAAYPTPASPLEAQRQDVDYFAKAIALDRSFTPAARTAAEAQLAGLEALPQALPAPRLHVALMQVMALADNGHSRVGTLLDDSMILPLRVTRFAEGYYVTRAAPAYRDMLGGRVESIDGQPVEQVLRRLDTLHGGVAGFRREADAIHLVVQDLLYGLGIAAARDASSWTVTLPDQRTVTHRVEAYARHKDEGIAAGGRWLSPEPGDGVERAWAVYHPQSGELPQTWHQPDRAFRAFQADGSCAQVVQLRSISDSGTQQIAPFLEATEAALRAAAPCAVILDLRGDGGGDYTNTWRFAHALPELLAPGGRIFVLTDPATFSAAITTTAFVKQAGGDRVAIIGEPVGDRLSFFSEGGQACLPNLGACAYYQTGKHDYAGPCDDWKQCFWLNRLYPVRVESLDPDVPVPLAFADWNAGHDRAYETALRLAAHPER
ncbi:MAG: hypothetical protein J7507_08705 [Pseudoxanthomonas sp.]|nr:hypothetical protein [Pseudoxanthomonas sp.]